MTKTASIYTVRNASGEFIGTFSAFDAKTAIAKARRANAEYFQTFSRKAAFHGSTDLGALTATIEPSEW